jgi:excisionase family DNA binding protein
MQGDEFLLTVEDVAKRIGKPVRFVREKLIKTGDLPHIKFGGNSIRIRPEEYRKYLDRGLTGFKHASPSGRWAAIGSN